MKTAFLLFGVWTETNLMKHLCVIMFLALIATACVSLGCVSKEERRAGPPGPRIESLVPDKVVAGKGFNVQPDGKSALSVTGRNLPRGARIRVNGVPLDTASGDGTSLAALVPESLTATRGMYPVSIDTPDGQVSNSLPFFVLSPAGPAPRINQLFPATAEAGKGFNVQPNGDSALGVTGENFIPGTKIVVNGKALETNFGDVDKLGTVMPPALFAKPGTLTIEILNPDGKKSSPATLTITQ